MTIEFNEENNFDASYKNYSDVNTGGLAGWLIKKGLAKDEKGASIIMITISVICFGLAIIIAL